MLEKDVDIWAGVAPVAVLVSRHNSGFVVAIYFPFISLRSMIGMPPSK